MTAGLLSLEAEPGNPNPIDGIFREAHTLKGGAGLVGLSQVSHLAHRLEDLLEELRVGQRKATPALTDSLLRVVDGLGRLIAGGASGVEDAAEVAAIELLFPSADAPPDDSPPDHPPTNIPPNDPPAAAPRPTEFMIAPPAEVDALETLPRPIVLPPPSLDRGSLQVPIERMDRLIRLVGEAAAAHLSVGHVLSGELQRDPESVNEYRDLTLILNQLQEVTMRTRMVPVGAVAPTLRRAVRDVARSTGKEVRWEIRGEDSEIDRGVLDRLIDPLMHLVRNAVVHGVELPAARLAAGKPAQASVRLHATQLGSEMVIVVSDDGAGIDIARVREAAERRGGDVSGMDAEASLRLVFQTGVSTAPVLTEQAGRGVGLDVVEAALDLVRGRIEVRTELGKGSEFRILVPITLTIVPCLIVSVAGQSFAIPMSAVIRVLEPATVAVAAGGRSLTVLDDMAMPFTGLDAALGLTGGQDGPCVVVGSTANTHAFRVDGLVGQRDVVVRGLGGMVPRLDTVSGASVEPDGSILFVLDVPAVIARARAGRPAERPAVTATLPIAARASLLVVDDALTVRELQRAILERAGYIVRTASDGREALALLAEQPADLVLTDVEMPNLDGFALTMSIRSHPRLANIPVLMVTSRASEEDRARGLEAGADGYIVKSAFDEGRLLSAVSDLLARTA